jgi:hypothetical protein
MNTTEKDIELFDGYMNGTMSDTDRAKFEERLQSDEAYRKAYELHSEVVLGIQRKELKAMLQEQEMQSSTDVPVAANVTEGGRTISMIFKLAVAACFFIGVCFVGYDFWKLSSLGGDYIAQLEQPVPRGNGVEETLALIYDDLQQGNYSDAQDNIDKARQLIQEEQSITYPTEEETEYHQQMLKLDSDELDWYQALLYAKTHKVFKAKKLLKQIAKSDSRFAKNAKRFLDNL